MERLGYISHIYWTEYTRKNIDMFNAYNQVNNDDNEKEYPKSKATLIVWLFYRALKLFTHLAILKRDMLFISSGKFMKRAIFKSDYLYRGLINECSFILNSAIVIHIYRYVVTVGSIVQKGISLVYIHIFIYNIQIFPSTFQLR